MFSEIHKFFNCNPSDFFSCCLSLHVACDLSRPRPTTADKIGHSGARCPRWRHRAMLQLIKNDEKIITQWAFSKDTTPRRQHGLSPPDYAGPSTIIQVPHPVRSVLSDDDRSSRGGLFSLDVRGKLLVE